MTRRLSLIPIGALLLSLSACGRKAPSAPTPNLAPPDKAATAENVEAEAEVKASKGPVELTLRVYKTKIKSEKESLWFQIRMRNIGKKKFPVSAKEFMRPGNVEMSGSGIGLHVFGPDGKYVRTSLRLNESYGNVLVPGSPSWPVSEHDGRDPETRKKIVEDMFADRRKLRERTELADALARKGVPQAEIDRKVDEYDERHAHIGTQPAPDATPPFFWLEPGASTTTLPWAYTADFPNRKPIGEYTEFWGYEYAKPGKYRIRALFGNAPTGWVVEYNKKHHIQPDDQDVLVMTPTVEFEVLP